MPALSNVHTEKVFEDGVCAHLAAHAATGLLELDADVRLSHYRLQRLGQQKLDLASGEAQVLRPVSEAGTGQALTDEQCRLAGIVERMNDLFAGYVLPRSPLSSRPSQIRPAKVECSTDAA